MKTPLSGVMIIAWVCLCSWTALLAESSGERRWYTHEFDGSTTPDKASGERIVYQGKAPPAESLSADGIYTMRTTRSEGSKAWAVQVRDWAPSRGAGTVEFRAKIGAGDGGRGSARFSVSAGGAAWIMFLRPDHIRCRTANYGSDPGIGLKPGRFHTVRLVIRDHAADVYLDGAAKPVVTNWRGFGSPVTQIQFGDTTDEAGSEWGRVQWDYIRWSNTYSVSIAQQRAAMQAKARSASDPADTDTARLARATPSGSPYTP